MQDLLIEDHENKVRCLVESRNKKLLEEEERCRLKSRALWISSGDKNMKFFHHFANYRRNKKHLWEIEDEEGRLYQQKEDIKNSAINYFKSFYQATGTNQLSDQVEIVRLFPRMVKDEEVMALEKPCTKEEILEVLNGFTKEKSLGPDGRSVEFYLHYFDLVGQDLLDVVEESRTRGVVKKKTK
jgi:hypothetical protein